MNTARANSKDNLLQHTMTRLFRRISRELETYITKSRPKRAYTRRIEFIVQIHICIYIYRYVKKERTGLRLSDETRKMSVSRKKYTTVTKTES